MKGTPLSERIHIVLCGKRNSGKSSLLNRLFNQEISIVSSIAGTTTDPVTKPMEMEGLGPVALTDTAGFDDVEDHLGLLRVAKSSAKLATADMVVLVSRRDQPISPEELSLTKQLKNELKPLILAETFGDLPRHPSREKNFSEVPRVTLNNLTGDGIEHLHQLFVTMQEYFKTEHSPLEGLVSPGDQVILVTPIDKSAPKGRLILPQVEVLRDLLDKECSAVVTRERELEKAYSNLRQPPKLVITDSQAFGFIKTILPEEQALTSFSILFARKKGDLHYFVESLEALKQFPPHRRVLILEACNHHRMDDDIGTVKIPSLFKKKVQKETSFEISTILPGEKELGQYSLVISCAGCMVTRNNMMRNIRILKRLAIPTINYGIFFAWANGLFPRALMPISSMNVLGIFS